MCVCSRRNCRVHWTRCCRDCEEKIARALEICLVCKSFVFVSLLFLFILGAVEERREGRGKRRVRRRRGRSLVCTDNFNGTAAHKRGIIITLKVYWLPLRVFSFPLFPSLSSLCLPSFRTLSCCGLATKNAKQQQQPDKNLWTQSTPCAHLQGMWWVGLAVSLSVCVCVGGASRSCPSKDEGVVCLLR